MSHFFLGLALWALLLALAACGGDSNGTDPAMDTELAEMVDTVVSTFDDLTVCTDKREGATAYVEDEKKAYVCESKRWTANDSLTELILDKGFDSAEGTEPGEMADTVVSVFDDLLACTKNREGATAYVEDEDTAYVCKKGLWVVDDSLTRAVRPDSEKKSSDGKSSSSGKNNPSSPVASSCKTEAGDNCEYGTLTDDRDGQTYKTVKIGEQWWMAENLNYETAAGSYCYGGEKDNCQKYGRLYTWATAVGKSDGDCGYGNSCNLGNVKVRGVCPEGWHLPDTTEWNALFTAVGGKATAGTMLKFTEGWKNNGNGSDTYFFSALPAGYRDYGGDFYDEGNGAYFWSSTEFDSNDAYSMYLRYYDVSAYLYVDNKYYGFSVRCLKDYGPDAEKKSSNDKSSSSEKNSSSSSVVPTNSSSSSVVPTVSVASPCKTATENNCEYGTLTDVRDGQTYKTVKIGEQWWMAENLNYRYIPQIAEEDSSSYCYNDDPANCAKYGRLYRWSAALVVCPEGWHLPDTTELIALFDAVGGQATAGKKLKSTEGWKDKNDGTSGNGSDNFGFSALPAGSRNIFGDFNFEGKDAEIWSSTEINSSGAHDMYLNYGYGSANLDYGSKSNGFSVRCLRD